MVLNSSSIYLPKLPIKPSPCTWHFVKSQCYLVCNVPLEQKRTPILGSRMLKPRRLSHPMTPHGIIGKLGCVFYSIHSFRLVAGYGVANKMSNTSLFNHPSVNCRFAFVCRRYHNDYIYYYIIQTHLWTVHWDACFSVPSLKIDLKVKQYVPRKLTIVLLCLRLALASCIVIRFAVVWFICRGFHSQCGRL